jgi:hypothetical protein
LWLSGEDHGRAASADNSSCPLSSFTIISTRVRPL